MPAALLLHYLTISESLIGFTVQKCCALGQMVSIPSETPVDDECLPSWICITHIVSCLANSMLLLRHIIAHAETYRQSHFNAANEGKWLDVQNWLLLHSPEDM